MPTRAVDSAVEKVCRHAGKVVRSLGIALWIRVRAGRQTPYLAGETDSTACA